MRIAFISVMSTAPWGGSEELWSRAAIRLAEEGHHVVASVAHWPQPSPRLGGLSKKGVEVSERMPPPQPSLGRRIWRKIVPQPRLPHNHAEVQWLTGQKPDLVVISQGQNSDGCGWMHTCRELNLPFTVIVQCNNEGMWPIDSFGLHLAEGYRAARRIYCVSRHNLALLERQLGELFPHAEVVWNPTNVSSKPQCAWPAEDGVWKIAVVARLEPDAKGQDLMLQTLARPAWRDRPIEVNFYGEGERGGSLKRLAERLGLKMVRFRGHTQDIEGVWKQNHLLALPSRYEGLPLALVEAMRCGRAALVTDAGGNAEVCVDGKTSFVVPAATVGLWEEGMERAWQHRVEWKLMGEAARQHAEALMPDDPVEDFCSRLLKCASLS